MRQTILIAALALAGCATAPGDAARPPGQPAPLAYGGLHQDIRVGRLIVRPLAVTEDSRCPVDVTCVWGGRVVLSVRVTGMAGERTISSLEPLALPHGGALELVSVTPARTAGRPGTPAPYRFGFRSL